MKIQPGKFYRRRDGQVVGPAKARPHDPTSSYPWNVSGNHYTDDGWYQASGPNSFYDLIAEVTVTDILPFELKAGERYNTTKPDGTPGPIVTLEGPRFTIDGIRDYFYFSAHQSKGPFDTLYITADGLCVGNNYPCNRFRITSPYVEPTPPTIAERLEKAVNLLARPSNADNAIKVLEGCIAELKGGAK